MECDTPAETLDEILADVKEKVAAPEIILITGGLVSRAPSARSSMETQARSTSST
jgi:hypothetical protein